jgi:hypothetical protein
MLHEGSTIFKSYIRFAVSMAPKIHIVTCRGLCVNYKRVLDWMIGFIETLFTQLGTTGNYSATGISTLHSSPLHTH